MHTYQLHMMLSGGGIQSIEIFDAANDLEAVAFAEGYSSQGAKDLWQGSRRVRTFELGHRSFQMRRFPFGVADDDGLAGKGKRSA